MHNLPEFGHVAGPIVGHQAVEHIAEEANRPVLLAPDLGQEVPRQGYDVPAPEAQGRKLEAGLCENLHQPFVQPAGLDQPPRIGLTGRHDAGTDIDRLPVNRRPQEPRPQQVGHPFLEVDGQVRQVIEKQGAFRGLLQAAGTPGAGSAGRRAEQLARQLARRQCAAAEVEQYAVATPAVVMEHPRNETFAGTLLANQQCVQFRGSNLFQPGAHLRQGWRIADQVGEAEPLVELLGHPREVSNQPLPLEEPLDRRLKLDQIIGRRLEIHDTPRQGLGRSLLLFGMDQQNPPGLGIA